MAYKPILIKSHCNNFGSLTEALTLKHSSIFREIRRLSRGCLKQTWEKFDFIPFRGAEAAAKESLFLLTPNLGTGQGAHGDVL